jgi:hypothetical protein
MLTSSFACCLGFVAKIADFGLARDLDVRTRINTRMYGTVRPLLPSHRLWTLMTHHSYQRFAQLDLARHPFIIRMCYLRPVLALWQPRLIDPGPIRDLAVEPAADHPHPAGDVYALGVLMWELYHGHRAWAGLSQTQVSCSPSVKTSAADPNLILTLP